MQFVSIWDYIDTIFVTFTKTQSRNVYTYSVKDYFSAVQNSEKFTEADNEHRSAP